MNYQLLLSLFITLSACVHAGKDESKGFTGVVNTLKGYMRWIPFPYPTNAQIKDLGLASKQFDAYYQGLSPATIARLTKKADKITANQDVKALRSVVEVCPGILHPGVNFKTLEECPLSVADKNAAVVGMLFIFETALKHERGCIKNNEANFTNSNGPIYCAAETTKLLNKISENLGLSGNKN